MLTLKHSDKLNVFDLHNKNCIHCKTLLTHKRSVSSYMVIAHLLSIKFTSEGFLFTSMFSFKVCKTRVSSIYVIWIFTYVNGFTCNTNGCCFV